MENQKPILAIQSCDDSGADFAKVELDDVVRSAQKPEGARNHISLGLRKKDGTEYGVFLLIPEWGLDKAIVAIIANIGITLRELGLLDMVVTQKEISRRPPAPAAFSAPASRYSPAPGV